MQLYIRGSWKTFTGRQEGSVINRGDIKPQSSFRNIENDLYGIIVHPGKKDDDGVSVPVPKVIFTENLPQLQRFYLALVDGHTISQDENKCVLCLGTKQYIVLVNEEHDERERKKRHPEAGFHGIGHGSARTERLHTTVSLIVSSIEALLVSYGQVKSLGIGPVQTWLGGTTVVMQFNDPDGNIVKLFFNFQKLADCSDLVGKDRGFESERSMTNVNPEVLLERLQLREAKLKVRGTDADLKDAAIVKLEPVMAE